MRKILSLLILLLVGLAVGGGAGYAAIALIGAPARAAKAAAPPTFVSTGKILAPLVGADGRLTGYTSFEVSIEVPGDKADFVTPRLPMLLHAINMRSYRTPMAAGPDGMLPNIDVFRRLVLRAAPEAFGPGVVRRVAVTQAMPV